MNIRISVCIICLSNEFTLQQTILKNIADNERSSEVEFVVVDCNPDDTFGSWIRNHAQAYIDAGLLIYYKLCNVQRCRYTTAKNIAMRLATGEVVCYVSAYDLMGAGFVEHVRHTFARDQEICLYSAPYTIHDPTHNHPPGSIVGKLCVHKSNLLRVGGFDERMIKYANDDLDIINRLERSSVRKMEIFAPEFGKFLRHGIGTGLSLRQGVADLSAIYMKYSSPARTEVLYLYHDGHYEKGTLINNALDDYHGYSSAYEKRPYRYRYALEGIGVRRRWEDDINGNRIVLFQEPGNQELYTLHACRYDKVVDRKDQSIYYVVEDPWITETLLLLNAVFYNGGILDQNQREEIVRVNSDAREKAALIRNFKSDDVVMV